MIGLRQGVNDLSLPTPTTDATGGQLKRGLKMKLRVLATMVALLCATPVAATVRVFDFVARVDMPDTFVPAGTIINGSFSYDETLSPTSTEVNGAGMMSEYRSPSITLSARVGAEFLSGGADAWVFDFTPGPGGDGDDDSVSLSSRSGDTLFDLTIWQPDRQWFGKTSLPTAYPSPLWQGPFPDGDADDEVTVPHGEFGYLNRTNGRYLNAVVLSVKPATVSAVPEPSTWAMLLLGFGLTGGALRSRGCKRARA